MEIIFIQQIEFGGISRHTIINIMIITLYDQINHKCQLEYLELKGTQLYKVFFAKCMNSPKRSI